MAAFKIGIHIRPQHTTIEAMRTAWKAADAMGVDSITVWDHFFPLIGGGGDEVTLRIVAEYADMSNTPGSPDVLRQKNRVIDDWCAKVGRKPGEIERTCNIPIAAVENIHDYVAAGAQRLQIQLDHPF